MLMQKAQTSYITSKSYPPFVEPEVFSCALHHGLPAHYLLYHKPIAWPSATCDALLPCYLSATGIVFATSARQ